MIHSLSPAARLKLTEKLLLVSLLFGSLGLMLAVPLSAQTFATLHSFTPISVTDNGDGSFIFVNSDGARPSLGLITDSSGSVLYGTAGQAGSSGSGAVFAVNTNGAGFTNLHTFTNAHRGMNTDGVAPSARLILSGATLYGVAAYGGIEGHGTVFAVNTDGSAFTNLHSFQATSIDSLGMQTNSGGAVPYTGLILAGSTLYGTAGAGGAGGQGTIFALNTNGTGFTNLHSLRGNCT